MIECSVLRCTSSAEEIIVVDGPGDESLPVCGSHKDAMDGGDDWVLRRRGEQTGRSADVLMAGDMPWRVLAASAAKVQGNRAGLLLQLTLTQAAESRDMQLLLPWDEAEVLKGMMDS